LPSALASETLNCLPSAIHSTLIFMLFPFPLA
jgi:hypothetical protein